MGKILTAVLLLIGLVGCATGTVTINPPEDDSGYWVCDVVRRPLVGAREALPDGKELLKNCIKLKYQPSTIDRLERMHRP